MITAKLIAALFAVVASARFSGDLTVRIKPDGSCYSAFTHVHDTELPDLVCVGNYNCRANGNEIATIAQQCRTDGRQKDSDLFFYPHDTAKFCRKGFCSCMTTHYDNTVQEGDHTAVHFHYDDDQAWNC